MSWIRRKQEEDEKGRWSWGAPQRWPSTPPTDDQELPINEIARQFIGSRSRAMDDFENTLANGTPITTTGPALKYTQLPAPAGPVQPDPLTAMYAALQQMNQERVQSQIQAVQELETQRLRQLLGLQNSALSYIDAAGANYSGSTQGTWNNYANVVNNLGDQVRNAGANSQYAINDAAAAALAELGQQGLDSQEVTDAVAAGIARNETINNAYGDMLGAFADSGSAYGNARGNVFKDVAAAGKAQAGFNAAMLRDQIMNDSAQQRAQLEQAAFENNYGLLESLLPFVLDQGSTTVSNADLFAAQDRVANQAAETLTSMGIAPEAAQSISDIVKTVAMGLTPIGEAVQSIMVLASQQKLPLTESVVFNMLVQAQREIDNLAAGSSGPAIDVQSLISALTNRG